MTHTHTFHLDGQTGRTQTGICECGAMRECRNTPDRKPWSRHHHGVATKYRASVRDSIERLELAMMMNWEEDRR